MSTGQLKFRAETFSYFSLYFHKLQSPSSDWEGQPRGLMQCHKERSSVVEKRS